MNEISSSQIFETTVIIPAAGLDTFNGWQANPKSMQTVLGRPFILSIFEHLIARGYRKFVVVENVQNNSISDLLQFVYSWNDSISINYVKQKELLGPLYAILLCREYVKSDDILIWLGDSFCTSVIDHESNRLFYGEVSETFRWCIADMETSSVGESRVVKGFFDKVADLNSAENNALIGVYYLKNASEFFNISEKIISRGEKYLTGYYEISQGLSEYIKGNVILAEKANNWVDVGNQDMMMKTIWRLLSARSFNQIFYKPELNVIEKFSSEKTDKLRNEIFWMSNLPGECNRFVPTVVDSSMDSAHTFLALDFVPFPSLSSSYLFQRYPLQRWSWVLDKVLGTFTNFFWKHKIEHKDAPKRFQSQIFEKLERRIVDYPAHIPIHEELSFNGKKFKPLNQYMGKIKAAVAEYSRDLKFLNVIHGDLCFSNILFDINTGLFKVVDPLGSFGTSEPSIYGHYLYDLAKLRQSISGKYDSLAFNFFHLKSSQKNNYELSVLTNPIDVDLTKYFDSEVKKLGYDIQVMKLIEASLFLSMVPLHSENPKRQLAMYLTGLDKAEEVFSECIS